MLANNIHYIQNYEKNSNKMEKTITKNPNTLLTPGTVCRDVLGLTPESKAWKGIRPILIREYGMNYIEGVGMRIPLRNVEKFLEDYYGE